MILEYAEKQYKGDQHVGETPVQVADDIVTHGNRAVELIESMEPGTKNTAELKRLLNDIYIHQALAKHYSAKVKAAIHVLSYKYSQNISSLKSAIPDLEASVAAYEALTALTQNSYLYANSMQTKQRKIPMRGVDATFKHWTEMLPVFEAELRNFKGAIDSLEQNPGVRDAQKNQLVSATVILPKDIKQTSLKKGAKPYNDQELVITHLPEELEGLQMVQVNSEKQKLSGTSLPFESSKPVKVLVGYYNSVDKVFAPKPILEIDATANDYGQADAKIRNALRVQYMPMLDIHTYTFPAGSHVLKLPKGEAIVLGFVDDKELQQPYNADIDNQGDDLDDLFGYYQQTKL